MTMPDKVDRADEGKRPGRIRFILTVLTIVSLISAAIGGYFYYVSLNEFTIQEIHQAAIKRTNEVAGQIDFHLEEHRKSAKVLAGLNPLRQALLKPNDRTLPEANGVLDLFSEALDLSDCFVMNRQGIVIASSNRNSTESFVGENYSFRPYFRQAMDRKPAVFISLGVTSGKRGFYFSHPVYGGKAHNPIGVVVIKLSLDDIDLAVGHAEEGIMVFTGPQGVIFFSSRPDWLFHTLWEVSPEQTAAIAASRQFGKGPWFWTGVKREAKEDAALGPDGKRYVLHHKSIRHDPEWNLFYLHDLQKVSARIYTPLFRTTVYTILFFCGLIGLFSIFLFWKAVHEIRRREAVEKELERLSYRDGLTGVANRRHFETLLDQEWRRAVRSGRLLSLIMCDIDFFKAYNDSYGHLQGDDCLKQVAQALNRLLHRSGDTLARYGGEEFTVLLPEIDAEGASVLAEAMRRGVEALHIPHVGSSVSANVTISLGVATLSPGCGQSPADLIQRADIALYQAKEAGRNRTVLSP